MGHLFSLRHRRQSGYLDVWCALVWVALYGAAGLTGERIDVDEAAWSWQLAPLDVLERVPLETLGNIHTQPPMWNAAMAAVLRWSPISFGVSIQLMMMVCGVVLCLAVFRIAAALGAPPRAAAVITLVATLNAQVVESGFGVRYELPVAALLALLLALVATRRSARVLVAMSATATLVTMTRASYHPLWLAAVVAIGLAASRKHVGRRALVLALAVPLVVVGGWTVKNVAQRGDVGLSSWSGMNLLRSVAPTVSGDDMAAMRSRGHVSEVAVVGAFQPYASYAPFMPPCRARSDVAVLADPLKKTTPVEHPFGPGVPDNFNYECYLPVFEQAGDDALAIVRHHPGDWLQARAWAANNWFTMIPLEPESPVLRTLEVLTRVVLVVVPHPGGAAWDSNWIWLHAWPESVALAVLTVVVLWAGGRAALRLARRQAGDEATVLLAVAAVTVAWTMLTGIGLELGEQDRFRAVIDPVLVTVGGAVVLRWWSDRRGARVDPKDET